MSVSAAYQLHRAVRAAAVSRGAGRRPVLLPLSARAGTRSCRIDCLAGLEKQLEALGPRAAGVLVEPMLQGVGGMIVWPPEFLAGVRRLCDRHGTLMIADEVLTGFGRTGRMFACEHAQVTPDIICLSKGLTAGYLPLAATAATEAIYEAFLSEDRRHGELFSTVKSELANRFDTYGDAKMELFAARRSSTAIRTAPTRSRALDVTFWCPIRHTKIQSLPRNGKPS